MTDPVNHATFTLERVYDASPQRVFHAFADADAHRRWFVEGEGFETADWKPDFRVGGREFSRFKPVALDRRITNDTVYQDIIPNRRIVWSYAMAFEGEAPFSVSLLTIELFDEGAATRLKLTEQGAYLNNDIDHARMREMGWDELLTALGREVARQSATA